MPKINLKSNVGFTLIELLVVISIITVLSVIGLSLYISTQNDARDAKRRGDIDATSQALEQHFTINSANPYPTPDPLWFKDGAIPKDPKGGDYYWNGSVDGSGVPQPPATGFSSPRATYTVCAQLEGNGGNSSDKGDGTTFTVSTSSTTIFYQCVKNLR